MHPHPPPQQDGGILLILGMPQGSEFGVDMKIYQVGPNFRGLTCIPLGLHLLTFGTGQGLRQGFFIRITYPQEVVVKSWDALQEEIVEEGTGLPEGSMNSLLLALQRGELNQNLGVYPEEEQGKLWRNLTNCVDENVLELCGLTLETRVLPGDWEEEKLRCRPSPSSSSQKGEKGEDSAAAAAAAPAAIVPYFAGLGKTASFTDIPGEKRPTHRDLTPAELTQYHLDRSERLEVLLKDVYGKKERVEEGKAGTHTHTQTSTDTPCSSTTTTNIHTHTPSPSPSPSTTTAWKLFLGEYQLAFILFLNLYSMGGLKHWKEATALLCNCTHAIPRQEPLFSAFLRVFFTQVKTIPADFFLEDEVGKESFLQPSLVRLLRNVRDAREGVCVGVGEGGREGEREAEVVGGEHEKGGGGGGDRGEKAVLSQEFCDYVEHFATLMEKRFSGLDLKRGGKNTHTHTHTEEGQEGEEEEDGEEGPTVVPWEEVERAMQNATISESGEMRGPLVRASLHSIEEETPA